MSDTDSAYNWFLVSSSRLLLLSVRSRHYWQITWSPISLNGIRVFTLSIWVLLVDLVVPDKVAVSHCFVFAEVALEDIVDVNVEVPGHVWLPYCQVPAHGTLPLLFCSMAKFVLVEVLPACRYEITLIAWVHLQVCFLLLGRTSARWPFLGRWNW